MIRRHRRRLGMRIMSAIGSAALAMFILLLTPLILANAACKAVGTAWCCFLQDGRMEVQTAQELWRERHDFMPHAVVHLARRSVPILAECAAGAVVSAMVVFGALFWFT